MRARAPQLAKARAATKPSPPLFPTPQTTCTRTPSTQSSQRLATVLATATPARSISAAAGMRYSSIASRSKAAISAPVTTLKGGCQASTIAQLRPDHLDHPVDCPSDRGFVFPFPHLPDHRFRPRWPGKDPTPRADGGSRLLNRL